MVHMGRYLTLNVLSVSEKPHKYVVHSGRLSTIENYEKNYYISINMFG